MAKRKPTTASRQVRPTRATRSHLSFDRINYLLMVAGAVILVIGFICMSGGEQGGKEFHPEEIYSPIRITVAPILVALGFLIEIFAIFYRRKPKPDAQTPPVK